MISKSVVGRHSTAAFTCVLLFPENAEFASCWWGGFTEEACCDMAYGISGNPTCWDATYTFARCCRTVTSTEVQASEISQRRPASINAATLDDADRDAIIKLSSHLGSPIAVEQLVLDLKRREAQNASAWWAEQFAMLMEAEAVQASQAAPSLLRQLPLVSFGRLLDALVPDHRRNRFALNIGGGDGKTRDPTFELFRSYDYGGVVIEADHTLTHELLLNLGPCNRSGAIHIGMELLKPAAVGSLIRRYRIPSDLDVMKIDIDSCDAELLHALLQGGLRPKVLAVEINPDIPPPFRWYMKHDRNFNASSAKLAWRGLYGASADVFFALLSEKHGYMLIAFELITARYGCPLCEHNMWFARADLVGAEASTPLISWHGMVRLFWSQIELLNTQCLHLHQTFSCPLQDIDALAFIAGSARLPQAEQSFTLASPENRGVALSYASTLQRAIQARCADLVCEQVGVEAQARSTSSNFCKSLACPSSIDVSRFSAQPDDQRSVHVASTSLSSLENRIAMMAAYVRCGYFTHMKAATLLNVDEATILTGLDDIANKLAYVNVDGNAALPKSQLHPDERIAMAQLRAVILAAAC